MKYLLTIILVSLLSSCADKYVLTTIKKHVYHGGNAKHFQKRAEYKERKAQEKALRDLYGKQ